MTEVSVNNYIFLVYLGLFGAPFLCLLRQFFGWYFPKFHNVEHMEHHIIYLYMPTLMEYHHSPQCLLL